MSITVTVVTQEAWAIVQFGLHVVEASCKVARDRFVTSVVGRTPGAL
jgi:hypothetical protein